ncbi:aspartate carbamoyltransferase regulatory subunit [Candidatus Bathyarchaeota archaeon]|jgi:aspartate carbamoyltransferase regulatory subunit|nr:MAG: aspartate carbamoyltransferase regulatory subunit [Candidatus Bathyarchaeota archaeon]
MMAEEKELRVQKIKEGTVIDHISAGGSLSVLKILGIMGREDNIVSIVMNVSSHSLGRKDIVKVEGRELNPEELDKIALVAPRSTINIVRNYVVVEKQKPRLPKMIKGIVKCANVTCISNSNEPTDSMFYVENDDPLRLRCYYCSRYLEKDDIIRQF